MATKGDKAFYLFAGFIVYGVVIGAIYAMSNYIGFTINIIFMAMIIAILGISIISEMIERTKITPLYFYTLCGLLLGSISMLILLKYSF